MERTGRMTEQIATGRQNPGLFRHVEIEITTACDLACFACDRFSDVTTAPSMTLEQVRYFVDESIATDWRWDRVRLLGGEPTLHPKFEEMCRELLRYREAAPSVFLQVLSNGHGFLKDYASWLKQNDIDAHVEGKNKGQTPRWFVNTRIAPVDRDPSVGALPPCGIFGSHGCGIGLTRHGYFLDGAGASAARVAGHDIGVMSLRELTWENMMSQAAVLCRICGHWNPSDHLLTEKVTETGEVTGPFWTEALAKFKEKRPFMRVYGDSA